MLPEPWGLDWSREETSELVRAMVQRKALGPPSGLGMMLAAPTIMTHGSEELKQRLLPQIFNGQHGRCQLFSQTGAGSDLAGPPCRAERDGDPWVVTGQKAATSLCQLADHGGLIPPADPARSGSASGEDHSVTD